MNTNLKTYVLNIYIQGIFEKDIKVLKRETLFDLTHMMTIVDLVAISIEVQRIDNRCTFKKELTKMNFRIL